MCAVALNLLVCALAFYAIWHAMRRGGFEPDRAMILVAGLLLALLAQHRGPDGWAGLLPALVLTGLAISAAAWLRAEHMRCLIVLAGCLSVVQFFGGWGLVAAGCVIAGVLCLSPSRWASSQLGGFLSLLLFLPVLMALLVHIEPGWFQSLPRAGAGDVAYAVIVALVLLLGKRHSAAALGTVTLNVCISLPLMLQA